MDKTRQRFQMALGLTFLGLLFAVPALFGCDLHKSNDSFVACAPWSDSVVWSRVFIGAPIHSVEESGIESLWSDSSQGTLEHRCPVAECGCWQPLAHSATWWPPIFGTTADAPQAPAAAN